MKPSIGLIAGGGQLPFLFARAARAQGRSVVAVAHRGETDPQLQHEVDALEWVRVGQLSRIVNVFKRAQVKDAVMAGGIGRVRALSEARPDRGALRVMLGLRSFRDDALLRGVAGFFERNGLRIGAPSDYLKELLAPRGHVGGPVLTSTQRKDVALGLEVARTLGRADVGQTVVVRGGHVLALEAVEGTDEAIRRGARLGGPGVVVVKVSKPGQDTRFDLPAVGPMTLEVMASCRAAALAVEAQRTLILDVAALIDAAGRLGISVAGVDGEELR